jgi:hypothetical protein
MRLGGFLLLLLLLVLVAAGCETEPSVYKAEPTAKCLREDGVTVVTERSELGVVERSAENGGLIAYTENNAVRIAFGVNEEDTLGIQEGYRRFAPKKVRPHIDDVRRTEKNAVLLWTVTPSEADADQVNGCLKG